MHPQLFLRTFWRMEVRPQIFVAMSFADQYNSRFIEVISPAIRSIAVNGVNLEPYRVDLSKSGDSILTDIMDNIGHSQMVLADVSSVGRDAVTGQPYRNANVMYEVGLALACRDSAEVLLIRDDRDKFLFDVSTVPHMTIDFTDKETAVATLREALQTRLREQAFINDARIRIAITGLSVAEVEELKSFAGLSPDQGRAYSYSALGHQGISRLLDKQLIQLSGQFESGQPVYQLTRLGRVVAETVKSGFPRKFRPHPEKPDEAKPRENDEKPK